MESEWVFFFSLGHLDHLATGFKAIHVAFSVNCLFLSLFCALFISLGSCLYIEEKVCILSVTQLVPYDFVYGAFDYVDFHLICTYLFELTCLS